MKVISITGFGQVLPGDVLLIKRSNEFIVPVEVKQVLNAGEATEEIVLSIRKNIYFIISMFLKGDSWVKECSKLQDGRIYSITNNLRDITCYNDDRVETTRSKRSAA